MGRSNMNFPDINEEDNNFNQTKCHKQSFNSVFSKRTLNVTETLSIL